MKAQMLKGLLEGCILKVIAQEETYGYRICEDLVSGGFSEVNEGTVYPILIRLEKKGFIASVKKDSPLGPKRKYFHLTDTGLAYLKMFSDIWRETSKTVDYFMEGGVHHENEPTI